jgi:MFS family permease
LDNSLDRGADFPVTIQTRLGLRYLWLQGLFNAISDNFYLSFMPLFALAYGASAGQIGWLTAIANLLGVLALFPGARAIEYVGQRKTTQTQAAIAA